MKRKTLYWIFFIGCLLNVLGIQQYFLGTRLTFFEYLLLQVLFLIGLAICAENGRGDE